MHFEGRSAVQDALRRVCARLTEAGVPFAVAGGMALFFHGFRRFTEDIDILVTRAGLAELHRQLDGLGYVPPFTGSKNLRDTELGVRIEFIVAGDYPGDGKPKAVAFPDPADVTTQIDGMPFLTLPALVELKLASGQSSPGRLKDLGDVEELIRVKSLPREYATELNESVRALFEQLWDGVREARHYDPSAN